MCFRKDLLAFTCYFIFGAGFAVKPSARAVSGPYTMLPIRVRNCTDPKLPYIEEPMVENNVILKNNIMSGNFTVLKDLRNYKTDIEDYYYEDGRRTLTFKVKKLTCLSRFQTHMIRAAGIVMDKKTCTVPKKTYSFNLDFNKIEHMWLSTREYGLLTRRIELYFKTRTIACYEYDFDVRPPKTERKNVPPLQKTERKNSPENSS